MISKSTFIAALALILVEHQSQAIKVVTDSDQTNWGSFSFNSQPIVFTRAPTVYTAPEPEPEPVVIEPAVIEPEVVPTPIPEPTSLIPDSLPDYTSPGKLGDKFDHVANTSTFQSFDQRVTENEEDWLASKYGIAVNSLDLQEELLDKCDEFKRTVN